MSQQYINVGDHLQKYQSVIDELEHEVGKALHCRLNECFDLLFLCMDIGSKGVNFCMAGASTSSGGKTGVLSYAGDFSVKCCHIRRYCQVN